MRGRDVKSTELESYGKEDRRIGDIGWKIEDGKEMSLETCHRRSMTRWQGHTRWVNGREGETVSGKQLMF